MPKEIVTITGKNHQPITIEFERVIQLTGKPYNMLKGKMTTQDLEKIPQFKGIKLEDEMFNFSTNYND